MNNVIRLAEMIELLQDKSDPFVPIANQLL